MSLLLAGAAASAAEPSYAELGSDGDYEAPDHLDASVFENYADTPQADAVAAADQIAQYDAALDLDEPEDEAGIYPAYWAQPPPDDQSAGFAEDSSNQDADDEHEGWYAEPLQDDGGVPVIPVIDAGAAGLGYRRRRAPSTEELARLHEAQTSRRLAREAEEVVVAAQLELEAAAKAALWAYESTLKQATQPAAQQTSSQRRKALETARKEAEKAAILAELVRSYKLQAYEIRISILDAQTKNDAIVLEEEEWLMLIAAEQSFRLI